MRCVEEVKEDVETSDKLTRAIIKCFKKKRKDQKDFKILYLVYIYIYIGLMCIVSIKLNRS